jgi:MFS family permease
MPGTLSILATVFPPAERPKAISVWASVAGGSVAVSITWSGAMLEHFWWGAIFLGMAAVAAVALVAGWWLLPTSRHPGEAQFDPVGALASVAGVTGLLYGFIQAPDDGWGAAPILAAFTAGIAALAGFAAWERHAAHPMLDIRFFAARRFSLGSLSIAAAYFALFGMYFVFTQYLQLVRGYSPLVAGCYALPAGLAQLAVAGLSRPFAARHGLRQVLACGLAASAAGLAVLAASGTASAPWIFEAGLGLLGVGIGLTMPPATGAIMSALPPHKAGVGSAVNDLDRELGGAFGVGVLASVTISCYRSRLGPALAGQPAAAVRARAGLAQALATAGAHSPLGEAARQAFSTGMDLAMAAGAGCVAAAAGAVLIGLRHVTRPEAPAVLPSPPDPALLGGAPAGPAPSGKAEP